MRSGSLFAPATVVPGAASNEAHHALLQHLVPTRAASPKLIPSTNNHNGAGGLHGSQYLQHHPQQQHQQAHHLLEAGWRPHSAGSSDGSDSGSSASSSSSPDMSRRGVTFARHMERSSSNPINSLGPHSSRLASSPSSSSSSSSSMARRAVSPSRAFAMPLSPRLQALGGRGHHERRLSGGNGPAGAAADPIARVPSPLLSPNASARALTLNPDPELPIDTVWVNDEAHRHAAVDGSHHHDAGGFARHAPPNVYTPVPPSLRDEYSTSPSSAAAAAAAAISIPGPSSPRRRSADPSSTTGAGSSPVFSREMAHSPILRLQRTPSPSLMAHARHERKRSGGGSSLSSSSPRSSPGLLSSSPSSPFSSSSPSSSRQQGQALATPRPIPTREPLDFEQPQYQQQQQPQKKNHTRSKSGSSTEGANFSQDHYSPLKSSNPTSSGSSSPISKILSPVGRAPTSISPQHALAEVSAAAAAAAATTTPPIAAASPFSNDRYEGSRMRSGSVGEHAMATDDYVKRSSSPSPPWTDSDAQALTSSVNPFAGAHGPETSLRTRSPALSPRILAAEGSAGSSGGAESPPKTRSFIGMPPRSGYELSDDPDDVGSEDGSSGRESVGTNDDREEEDDEEEEEEEEEDDDDDDEEKGDRKKDGKRLGEGPNLPSRMPQDGGFVDEVDGKEGAPANDHAAARPVAPRRPSLTHAPVVPPVPANDGVLGFFRSSDDESMGWRSSVIERAEERIRNQEENGDFEGGDHSSMSSSESDATGLRPFLTLSSGVVDGPSPFDGPMPTAKEAESIPGEASLVQSHKDEDEEGEEEGDGEEEDNMDAQPTEESLTTLERIFLFAKSEMAFHRVLVARSLADWILDVELSDAVEYVIPLLNGLACDELEVCSAFVPNLHKVMWFFFRNCPLMELIDGGSHSGPGNGTQNEVETAQNAVSKEEEEEEEPEHGNGDAAKDNDEEEEERATRPQLPVGMFTPMLCALLLNSNADLAGSAQAALVHFFARLRGLAILGEPGEQQSQQVGEPQLTAAFDESTALVRDAAAREGQRVQLAPYGFGAKERELVEAEILDSVAFAIGKLHTTANGEADEGMDESANDAMKEELGEEKQSPSIESDDQENPNGREHASRQEQSGKEDRADGDDVDDDGQFEQIDFTMDDAEKPMMNGTHVNGIETRFNGSPEQMLNHNNSDDDDLVDMEEAHEELDENIDGSMSASEEISFDPHAQSQTMEDWSQDQYEGTSSPVLSAFGQYNIDEEAAVGRMASVSLLAALSTDKLIQQDVLVDRVVPEIVRLHADVAFFVRKEVAIAMGALARSVVDPVVIKDQLLPAFVQCCQDQIWHVRQAACLSLPNMYSRVDAETRQRNVVHTMRSFVSDVSRNVRAAALETIGEVIYLFHGDSQGVPEPLLRHYLGEPFDGREPEDEDEDAQMEDDSSSVASNPGGMFMSSAMQRQSLLNDTGLSNGSHNGMPAKRNNKAAPPSTWSAEDHAYRSDPERSLVMAYNLPAVLLTIGKEQWPRLRAIHQDLCTDVSGKVRRSLAASLHEVAKIVGPQAASQDVLPLFRRALVDDNDMEVRAAALEHADVLLCHVNPEDAEAELRSLHGMWQTTFASSWRLRERLVQLIPNLAPKFLLSDDEGTLVHLMRDAIVDVVSAVRAAGVVSVPTLYQIFEEHDQVVADGFLGMVADIGENESYRARVGCLMSMQALFHHRVQRSSVEMLLLNRLVALGRDPVVDVRIALAKAIALMCRLDELYASPQSRSEELIGLLRRLSHDRSPVVRNIILELLDPDDLARQPDADADAKEKEDAEAEQEEDAPRRHLVLGPASGGPHRPPPDESTLSNGDTMMMMLMEAQNQSTPFAMDEDADEEEAENHTLTSSNSPGEVGLRRFSNFYQNQRLDPSAEGDASMFEDADDDDDDEEEEEEEDEENGEERTMDKSNQLPEPEMDKATSSRGKNVGAGTSPSSFEEDMEDDEEPHHLLSVGPDSPERAFSQVQLQPSAPTTDSNSNPNHFDASLTSPERPFKLATNGSGSDQKDEGVSASSSTDPFLAFVVDKRSSFHGDKKSKASSLDLASAAATSIPHSKARPLSIDARGANDSALLHKIESLRSPGVEGGPADLTSSSSLAQEEQRSSTSNAVGQDNHEEDTTC